MRALVGVGLLLRTEAVRSARHGSTWGLRAAWATALAIALAVPWAVALADPRADAGLLGRDLFAAWRDLVLLLAAGVAPVVVAAGAALDRRDPTIELVSLAGLSAPVQRATRAAARLLRVAAVVGGGLPLVALIAGMGGVAPWEIVTSVVNGLGLMVAVGAVAGTLAAGTGRPWGAVAGALAWGWGAFFALPGLLEYALNSEVFLGWRGEGFLWRFGERAWTFGFDLRPGAELLSPVAALAASGPSGLLPLAAVAVALGVAGAEARRAGAVRPIAVLAAPTGAALWVVGLRLPEAVAPPLLWGGAVVLVAAWTALCLDVGRWALDRRDPPRRVAREVVGEPLVWREVATGGPLGARPWTWWALSAGSALLLAGWWVAPAGPSRPADLGLVGALWIVAVAATVLSSVSGVADEILGGTWDLLAIARSPARGWLARLAVTGIHTLPVVLVAAAGTGAWALPAAVAAWCVLAVASQIGARVVVGGVGRAAR